MDVHQAESSVAGRDAHGNLVMEAIVETKAETILQFIRGLRGSLSVTFEEGTWAAWLHDLLQPHINHNHDLKNIFKGAATRAASTVGPFQDFYQACVARGVKPHLARLTLARKIAATTLLVWKKGVRFDAEHLKQQAA